MDPLTLLLIGGGALALLAFAGDKEGNGNGAAQPAAFIETEVFGGADGDEHGMVIDAITAKVSPFDKDTIVVFYNAEQGDVEAGVQDEVNASAKKAGIKSAVHVFGPSPDAPAARHYKEGVLVEEQPAGTDVDVILSWVESKASANAGRKVIAHAGQRKMIAAVGAKGAKHMAAMHAGKAGRGMYHPPGYGRRKQHTVQARAGKRGRGYPVK